MIDNSRQFSAMFDKKFPSWSPQTDDELERYDREERPRMRIRVGSDDGGAFGFLIVILGVLIMIRVLRVDAGALVAAAYAVGVYVFWRATAVPLRSARNGGGFPGGARPEVPPV